MANYTQGDIRPVLQSGDVATYQGNGSLVLDSRRTRPLWFDGRFLAARDLEREQNYFLFREADLGRAPGFGVIRGLAVDTPPSTGQATNADIIVIRAGQGITPAGEFVTIPSDLTLRISDLVADSSLDAQFGISTAPPPAASNRTGLYIIALRPVQFTANPITAYPLSVQGSRRTRDGDIVEATALSLIPYPDPANNSNAATRHAALARQIFVTGNSGQPSDSVLPLTMVSMQAGAIDWIDQWLVRREMGSQFSGLRFGLTDPPTQQAFLQQYDTQLQQAVNIFVRQNLPARFAATDYFQALPPAGRFPIGSISTDGFTQLFFPQQMDVRLSIVPQDELPALLADSMAQPPIDLTLSSSAYTNLTVFALIPVPRQGYAALAANLPSVAPTTILPQVLSNRLPIDLLRFYQGNSGVTQPSGADNSSWQGAIGTQTFGYYLRRRSSAPLVVFSTPPPPPPTTTTSTTTTTTTAAPTTTTTTTTTTTAAPTTTTTTTSTTTTTTTSTPAPLTITTISPPSLTAGGPDATVVIVGTGFNSATTLLWTVLLTPGVPTALATTFVNSGQLTAIIPASLFATMGTGSISARNGSQSSNAMSIIINPAPLVLNNISPNHAIAGGAAFTLTVNGSGFTNLAVVIWNGASLTTTFVSATQLTAAVPANLIASVATAQVAVSSIKEANSASLPFTITVPLAITSISPTSVTAGASAFTLTVTGTGFGANLSILWNGNALPANVPNASQLTTTVSATLVTQAGSISISVLSNGQASNTLPFTVNPAPLILTSISPNTTAAGGPILQLTVNGSGFTSSTQVVWNANVLATNFVSATQLTASVPASLIASTGSATVGVQASGQTSPTPLTFTITPGFFLTSASPNPFSSAALPTLTVTGGGFITGTQVFWNTGPLITTIVSVTQMTATVIPSLLPASGSVSVTAKQGSLTSNALTVTIVGPQVALSSLSPTSAAAGVAGVTLTVNGSLFTSSTLVTWNGTSLATTFVSAAQLTATVPASLLTTPGTANVTVTSQPQATPLTFTINKPLAATTSTTRPVGTLPVQVGTPVLAPDVIETPQPATATPAPTQPKPTTTTPRP